MPKKKGRKVTVEDEVPLTTAAASTGYEDSDDEYGPNASAGTASDPNFKGPGVQYYTIGSGFDGVGQSGPVVNGPNPATAGQQPFIHYTSGASFRPGHVWHPATGFVPHPGVGPAASLRNQGPQFFNSIMAAQGVNGGGPTYMGANTQGNILLQPGQPPMMLQPGQQPQPGVQYFAPGMPGQQGYPAVMNTPGMPQPTGNFVIGGGMNQNLWGNTGAGAPGGFPGAPDIMGIGRTGAEHNADILNAMHTESLLEPQEMVPKDDDPSRMYLLRELDGNWTKRNRFTLNRLAVRWYVTPWGGFYAVRLED